MSQAVAKPRSELNLRRPGRATATDPDARLIEESRNGSQEAFGQLVDRYKDPLVNYLARLVRCPDRAQDLAQETFIRLYRNLHRYEHRGQLSAFLFRIATNLVRSEERRAKRWRLIRGSGELDLDAVTQSPFREALSSETVDRVQEAIQNLPLNFRAPLVLRENEGWSYEEISNALGAKDGTVKSRIHRAKEQLRNQLRCYWEQ